MTVLMVLMVLISVTSYLAVHAVLALNEAQETHLHHGEQGELPGQPDHQLQHEDALDGAAYQQVTVQRHGFTHLVHVRMQTGGQAS